MPAYDALELKVIDQEGYEYIRASDEVPIEEELVRFMKRTHDYELVWVKVESGKYVRYDRIESVAITRGLDDDGGRTGSRR